MKSKVRILSHSLNTLIGNNQSLLKRNLFCRELQTKDEVHASAVDPQADHLLAGCDVMPPVGTQHPPEDSGPLHLKPSLQSLLWTAADIQAQEITFEFGGFYLGNFPLGDDETSRVNEGLAPSH